MNSALTTVGMPGAFGYAFPLQSLPLTYEHADQLFAAADPTGRTLTGTPFSIAAFFWDWIRTSDIRKKIDMYRDDLSRPGFRTMERNFWR